MCCPVKGNQPNLKKTIRAYIDDMRIENPEHITVFSGPDMELSLTGVSTGVTMSLLPKASMNCLPRLFFQASDMLLQ